MSSILTNYRRGFFTVNEGCLLMFFAIVVGDHNTQRNAWNKHFWCTCWFSPCLQFAATTHIEILKFCCILSRLTLQFVDEYLQGSVVQKPISANPGIIFNPWSCFQSSLKRRIWSVNLIGSLLNLTSIL